MLKDIVSKKLNTFFIVKGSDCDYLLLYLPYKPFNELDKNHAEVNAFYLASNELYFLTKELVEELREYNAKAYNGNLKKLFKETKCGIELYNTLIAIPPYGSRLTLSAIELNGAEEEVLATFDVTNNVCEKCGRCRSACPTNALEEGFIREKCLRDKTDRVLESDYDLELLEGSILGCDFCQRICPFNVEVSCVDYPDVLKEELDFATLEKHLEQGRRGLQGLASFIGANYNRPARIARMVEIAKRAKNS